MDPNLQGPLQRLAEALHRAIEQSAEVESAMSDIRDEGVQAWLLLEVTVALGQAPSEGEPDAALQMGFAEAAESEGWVVEIDGGAPAPDDEGPLAPRVAPDDREFLKSIRIRLD